VPVTGLAEARHGIGEQHRLVERKDRGVGIVGDTDNAGHGGRDGADWTCAVVDLNDTNAVVVVR
jgi:hypothetical protein